MSQAVYAIADADIKWAVHTGWISLQLVGYHAVGYLTYYVATRPPTGRQVTVMATSATERSALLKPTE